MQIVEKRKFPRVSFDQTDWVFMVYLDKTPGSKPVRLDPKNISGTGLKFLSNVKFALGEIVRFSILDKLDGSEICQLESRVVRTEESDTGKTEKTFGTAVEFPFSAKLFPQHNSDT